MDPAIVAETVLVNPPPADFSLWTLFIRADVVVQAVILGLLVASFWSWAIIYEKVRLIRHLRQQASGFEEMFWAGRSLDEIAQRMRGQAKHPMAAVFTSAMAEWNRIKPPPVGSPAEPIAHIEKVMDIAIARESDQLGQRLLVLATVGSVAPFVGLFGTVWGIMNSFQSIAISRDTSLAVVAPGIAEALFATALGLLAAIPAVIFYNRLNNELALYTRRLENFADELSTVLSRRLVGSS